MTIGIFRAGQPNIININVDLRLAEMHTAEALITTIPIEDGSVISDHIVIQPDFVEITAEVSNIDNAGNRTLGERAKTAWANFKEQMRARELYDLVTFHEQYTDMALETLAGEHTAPHTGKLTLNMKFKKVNITQTELVRIPESRLQGGNTPEAVAKTASSEVNGGQVETQTQAEDQSYAVQILEALRG